jgi:transcriptional regulator with PAS, ATPase and Fis domain
VLTEGVREAFYKYSWPGNIRELRNCVEFTALMTTDGVIDVDCLPKSMVPDNEQVTDESLSLQQRVKAFERQEILNTIKKYGNDTKGKKAAAKALGIALSSLYAKLEQK